MPRASSLISLIIVSGVLTACSLAADITPPPDSQQPIVQQATQSNPYDSVYPIVPPDPVEGAKIYTQECAQCHGLNGLGDGPQSVDLSVPVATLGLSDFARQYSPAEWYTVVTQGNMGKFMPAFANLTDRQRWDVVAYAMSLSTPGSLLDQGSTVYLSNCVPCHGLKGRGNGSQAASLSSQPKDFTNQALMAQTSNASLDQAIASGIAPDMPAYSSTLKAGDRLALVSYIRSLTYANPPSSASSYPPPANLASAVTANPYPNPQTYPNPDATPSSTQEVSTVITPSQTFTGTVTVQLVNGSGGEIGADAPVTLYAFDDMQNTYSETLSSNASGVYTFTNISMPAGRAFLASAEYASGTYGSDIAMVDPANPNLRLQITVYEPTTDISLLTTDRVHILLDFATPNVVNVMEVFIISNPSKQAVVSPTENGSVVTFPLPHGYTNLQFQDGELGSRYVQVSQGFADTVTVSPGQGEYQVIFAFQLPYDHKLNFSQPMFLPTSAVVVMLPENGIKVDSAMLQDGGTQQYQDTTYRKYNGSSLSAGSSLDFSISGSPKETAGAFFSTTNMQYLAIGLAAFGVAFVAGALWLYNTNRRRAALQAAPAEMDIAAPYTGEQVTPEDEDTLIDAIIALDDQYHAGNLPEDAYLERRAILKEKLRRISQG